MASPINGKNWTLFVKQAKGLGIDAVHVTREDRGAIVLLKYNGKARNGRIVSGEWKVETKNGDAAKEPAAIDGEIREFLEKARKSFFVKREGSLAGEVYKGKQDDEAAKKQQLGPAEVEAEKKG
jgi:hypothetical protein